MKITIVFKNGFQLNIECEEFEFNSCLGIPSGYSIKGIKDNKPIYIDWEDVSCVYRNMRGENE